MLGASRGRDDLRVGDSSLDIEVVYYVAGSDYNRRRES